MTYIKIGTSDIAGAAVSTENGGVCAVETMATVTAGGDLIRVRGQQAAGVPYKLADGSVIPIRAVALVDGAGDPLVGVSQQAAIADLAAAPTAADFNGLLAALRSAGVLAAA